MKKAKKFIIGVLCGAMVLSTSALASGAKQLIEAELNTINITVNGTPVDGENILYQDRTYVPLRAIAQMLGKTVTWDGDTNTAGIHDATDPENAEEVVGDIEGKDTVSGKQMIEVELNAINITVNGTPVDGENILYQDRTYIPLRAIAEMLKKTVTWDGDTNTAGIHDMGAVTFSGEAIGKVDGKEILQGQLAMYIANAKAEDADLTEEEAIAIAKENIAYDEAVLLLAKDMDIRLDAEFFELYAAYVDEMNAKYSYLGPEYTFENLLNAIGYTPEGYQRLQEIEYLKSKIMEKYSESYAPSEDEIANFYNEHKEEFRYDGLIAKHILFSTEQEDGSEMTEAQIKAVEKKATEVYNKIRRGDDFDTLMVEYSEDPGLAANPGGYVFTKGEMVAEFEEAAYALEVGEVSKPVKSVYGYHIIKLVEKVDYFDTTNNAVYEYILSQISLQKVEDAVKEKLATITLTIGSKNLYVNDTKVELDVPA